jgi:PAS domain S-box-containing protein
MQIAASTGVGTSNYEFDLVFNDGVTKNLLGNVVPLFDRSGKPAGAVAAFVDITERKRVEDELRKREAQLQAWKEHLNFWSKATNSTFWVLGPDGSYQDPKLTGTVISGRSFEQVRGWKWIDILHPEDQEHARLHWQNAMVEQTAFEIESRVWHEPSREYHWFSHRAVPLVQEGRLAGWIGASIDIQEPKEMEAVRRENEIQMATQRRLMKAREEERANIARDLHDGPIQTLIATIFELHELRGDASDPGLRAGLGGIGTTVTNAIHELRQVVNELRPPTLIDFGLAKAIQEHVADIQEKFPQIQLSLDLAESAIQLSEPISLSLYRICQEALRNIIRHSQATQASVFLSHDQDQVILEIQDNGLGFSFTDDFSTLTVDKHFGLAGMKERAEAIGGKLQIFSEPGEGTKVAVFAPISPID